MKIKLIGAAGGHVTGSCYSGQTDLLAWIGAIAPSRPRVVVAHGEEEQRGALARKIEQKFRLKPALPRMNEVNEI